MANERRASSDMLDELHALQAATLMGQVKRYTEYHNPETGKLEPQEVPPALLAQVAKFLKDNGVDSPGRGQKLRDDLKGSLPDLPDPADVVAEHLGHY